MDLDWETGRLEDINAFVFHTVLALSAPTGHLPLEGKVAIQKYRALVNKNWTRN